MMFDGVNMAVKKIILFSTTHGYYFKLDLFLVDTDLLLNLIYSSVGTIT